ACQKASDEFGFEVRLALDVAATELYDGKSYAYKDGKKSSADQVQFLSDIIQKYNIVSVEDGLAEDDWDAWTDLTKRVGSKCLLIGDDVFVTNPARLLKGIETGAANAILVKPNQTRTLTRTLEPIGLAHEHGYKP